MKLNRTIICLAAILAGAVSFAGTTPGWIRKSSISPDGQKIAFAWQGDIYIAPIGGGTASKLTSNPAMDSDPLWTADGKNIVFSSDREISKDVWTVPVEGGIPRRLTTYGGSEVPLAVSADGKVYFSANIQPDVKYDGFPGDPQLYAVPFEGGRPVQVSSIPMSNVSINASGDILYEDIKGYEDSMRKHHTSSVTRDVWKFSPAAGSYTKMSSFIGEDRNPVWAADGDSYYYLSEEGGNFNVWRSSVSRPQEKTQVTFLPEHPCRYLSIAGNGTLLFSYNGDLYRKTEGADPEKIELTVNVDKNSRDVIRRSIMSGISDISAAEGGKELAVVAHGDVFVTAVDAKLTRRITNTPEEERGVSFSKDGRSIFYAAERNGHWGIYKCSLVNKDDNLFSLSYEFKEEQFSEGNQTCFQPQVSPDGKWVAFLRDRTELVIKNIESGKEKSLLKGVNYSYSDGDQEFEWAPDSRHILVNYGADGGWNNQDIALIDIDDCKITNLTRSGYSDGGFRWGLKGKVMTWSTDRNGYRSHGSWGAESDVYAMFFDAEAFAKFICSENEDKIAKLGKSEKEKAKEEKKEEKDSLKAEKGKTEKLKLDLDNRDDRTVRLTRVSGRMGDHFLSPDGTKLFYTMRLEKGMDLCCLNIKDGSISVVSKGVRGPFIADRDGKYLYTPGLLGISRIDMNTGKKDKSISFSSEYDYKPAEERAYIFEHCWKQVKEKFYDENMHGVDWDALHDNYAQFLPFIDNGYDFQELLSELLGELNGSHTGARYYARSGIGTGHLGVLFDQNWNGEGLRIAEILPGSLLQTALPELEAGDIITAVDGEKIGKDKAWYDVLLYKSGKRTRLDVKHGSKTHKVFVTPSSSDSQGLYKRWVRSREKMVEKLSGGRVGYVHVKGMDSDSFREVYSKALGRYRSCEALIVDTRHNGGGWLHDDLVTFLDGKAYIEFRPRGQYIGTEPYSKWTKPSCVLMGEDNYSDACGFPYCYKALGVGKLVGAPVPGTMTAVWWEYQIDGSTVFGIPQVTSWGLDVNRALENYQIEPDVLVYNEPEKVAEGVDQQLEAAVKLMLGE